MTYLLTFSCYGTHLHGDERGWPLMAADVRSAHVHVVLGCASSVERILAALKAAATRSLNRADGQLNRRRWSRGGSVRPLRTPEAVTAAIRYVVEGQGDPMSVYRGS
ncbi:MAG: hypothetical protein K2X03_26745 [Bryobacteraceae bacterium]|nr:hypothetical protein [Bryobacteraceae bacterium]